MSCAVSRSFISRLRPEDYDEEDFESDDSSISEEESRCPPPLRRGLRPAVGPLHDNFSLPGPPLETPLSTAVATSDPDGLDDSISSHISSWNDASLSAWDSEPSFVATEVSSPHGGSPARTLQPSRLRLGVDLTVSPASSSSCSPAASAGAAAVEEDCSKRPRPQLLDVSESSMSTNQHGGDSPSATWSVAPNGTLRHRPTGTCFSTTRGITYAGKDYKLSIEDLEVDTGTPLGAGACGVVSKARIRQTNTAVAVKTIQVNSKEKREQLLNEIRTLVHAEGCNNLVQWYAGFVSSDIGKVLVALEYMDLGSLHDLKARMPSGDGVPIPHLACVSAQVMAGLHHLHKHQQIHRDIKPQNALHNRAGVVKLTDFGIAKDLSGALLACTFVGTAIYMAPERCLGKDYSFNSDIWSVGMVLFELATGRYPYPAVGSFPALVDYLCEQEEPRLDIAQFPREAREFVANCLTRDTDQRPSSETLVRHPFLAEGGCERSRKLFAAWLADLVPM